MRKRALTNGKYNRRWLLVTRDFFRNYNDLLYMIPGYHLRRHFSVDKAC
jgi:hypothetical protein